MSPTVNQKEATDLTQEQKYLLETLPKFKNQLEHQATGPLPLVEVKDPWKENFDKLQKWMVSHDDVYPSTFFTNDIEEMELAKWFKDQTDVYKKTQEPDLGSYIYDEAMAYLPWMLCCQT